MEKDFDLRSSRRMSTHEEIFNESIPYPLQVNYTDTKLSHRFIRFEIPKLVVVESFKNDVQEYLNEKLRRKDTGVHIAKLQVDTDLIAEDGEQVISHGHNAQTGSSFMTVTMVCDIRKEKCYNDFNNIIQKRLRKDQDDFKASVMKSILEYQNTEREHINVSDDQLLF